jgi:hypothetical protein
MRQYINTWNDYHEGGMCNGNLHCAIVRSGFFPTKQNAANGASKGRSALIIKENEI